MTPGNGESFEHKALGIEVANLTAEVADKLGIKEGEGVVITDVRAGSPAEMAGLTSGTVIVQVNRRPVKSIDDFRTAIEQQPLEKGVLMLVRTAQGTRFIVITAKGQ